jgi:hypothetical protein
MDKVPGIGDLEYRYAYNRLDRLPHLVADLVRGQAVVIVGNSLAAESATAATTTIPIVFERVLIR